MTAGCKTCGRDNDNGTHSALELTGHLSHPYEAAEPASHVGDRIRGRCPMGCGETLFVGASGYVTCSFIDCPDPAAPTKALSPAILAQQLAALSRWIDDANADRNPEAALCLRVAKVGEEHGEAVAALIGLTGQNPRKGITHTKHDLEAELLDVAVTALAAVEHLNGNRGEAVRHLTQHVSNLHRRAELG